MFFKQNNPNNQSREGRASHFDQGIVEPDEEMLDQVTGGGSTTYSNFNNPPPGKNWKWNGQKWVYDVGEGASLGPIQK